jgi:primosomal protein N' (replication factor Y)
MGLGTEQLEGRLAEIFAPARVARLDRDVASGRTVEEVLGRLRRREVDLLVGTQMVTKGHDLPGVTLVGVILADHSLGFPDFRASERTFQLLAQVAGRAGRGEREGKVYFQTFNPDAAPIQAAATHDYEAFFRAEAEARREHAYPPFGHLIAVRVDDPDEGRARETVGRLATIARRHADERVEILGPSAAPIGKLRTRYRFRFLLRSIDRRALRRAGAAVAHAIDEGAAGASRASVDVDPVSML